MPNINCTCKGENKNCEKCFGIGEYNPEENESRKIFVYKKEKDSSTNSDEKALSELVKELKPEDLIKLANQTINKIDRASRKQKRFLFRNREFDDKKLLKYDAYEKIKDKLRRSLGIILKQAKDSNITFQIKYKQPFSKNNYEVSSPKDLKKLKGKLVKSKKKKESNKKKKESRKKKKESREKETNRGKRK